MVDESRLRAGGPDAPNRESDFDWIGRAGKLVERYKIFYILLVALLAWWGKNVIDPLRTAAETTAQVRLLNQKIDNVIVPRLDSADARTQRMIEIQETQTTILGTLTRLRCLQMNLESRTIANLNCKDIPLLTVSKEKQ